MNYQKELLPIPDLSGQSVGDDRFKLLELIGFGASGTVYRALDTQSDPCDPVYYAIKCLLNTELSQDGLVWQKREIACHWLASRSSSPHICKLHQIIEEGLYMYFVLDYCPGGDLFTAIKLRKYEGNVPLIKKVFIELLDGVHACHSVGVYHRDLKPENILCVEPGSGIRIADFGLSTTKLISREFNVGSWDYLSPGMSTFTWGHYLIFYFSECNFESGSPHYSSLHSDIWSLGVILVNMVSGRSPWGPATPSDQNFRKYINNPNFLLEVLPISKSFNEILKRIFHLRESARISLLRLREEIINLDTFYPSEVIASKDAREPARKYTTYPPHQAMAACAKASYWSSDSSADSGAPQRPQWDYRSSAPAVQWPGDIAGIERTSSHLRIYDGDRSLSLAPLSLCSTCSVSESEESITPENCPHEPMIHPSDLFGQKGLMFYSLPPPPYIHPSYLCDICLRLLSPSSVISSCVDTGGKMQAVSTI
ncbi:serine/threonine protein kinase, negative regulator of sexual conjugation and meiosis [Suillus subalutaceus]|uniref:serine/threonine protein kinase, negative regulator of sexual conjugation and meiosis n=1 Tax=Suillus subalutaceus TaxID=48586 RepID=UPI001B87F257|nr:serine/threonine protein kinase, negative regulator of sexual conjugation and meiosis [Suillus subalutaceus]KAG1824069.1 serine/threonine protein kinase, negative regulator of sexual conjugation and meiosis [Suillus subalutaceus]